MLDAPREKGSVLIGVGSGARAGWSSTLLALAAGRPSTSRMPADRPARRPPEPFRVMRPVARNSVLEAYRAGYRHSQCR
jgi:hypothetical protein